MMLRPALARQVTLALAFSFAIAPAQAAGRGKKAPTIIFESGLGSGAGEWRDILSKVKEKYPAYAHNRPGYEGTELAPSDADGVRDANDAVKILKERLKRERIAAPYILVGHSNGALYALRFAKLYPRKVAALVLVDGRLPNFYSKCVAAAAPCAAPPPPAKPDAPQHLTAERMGVLASEAQGPKPEELGNIPVTLITRGTGSGQVNEIWQESHREFAARLKNGRHVVAAKSGHFVQRDEPNVVLEEIDRAVERSRVRRR